MRAVAQLGGIEKSLISDVIALYGLRRVEVDLPWFMAEVTIPTQVQAN